MDRLRQMIGHIAAQLGVLTVSQRLAIGLCAALIVASLLWLMQWSTTPEMVPLINAKLNFDELSAAEDVLRDNDIDYRVTGSRIFVRARDQHNAMRLAHGAGALPEGSLFDMTSVITNQSPFSSPDQRAFAQTWAKANELAKIIATTPFVQKANVIINEKQRRRIGMPNDMPTASVNITLVPNKEMMPEMVDGVARLVAGAVAGLTPSNVSIRDSRTGRSFNIPSQDSAISMNYLEAVKKHEKHLVEKIMDQLADIPGLRANVAVALDTNKSRLEKFTYDDPQPRLEQNNSSESKSKNQATEPGVQPNLGTAVTSGGRGQSSTKEDTKTENFPPALVENELIEELPLSITSVSVAVSIPRSYIAGLYTTMFPDKDNPKDDDPDFVSIRDRQIDRVHASVQKIVMAKHPDDVTVDMYPDMKWSAEAGAWTYASGSQAAGLVLSEDADPMTLARRYGPPVGLSSLALFAMFMVLRMVRKSSDLLAKATGELDTSEFVDGEAVLDVGSSGPIGQAATTEGFLTGRELDEEDLRYQEFGVEVAEMVKNDPANAANLIQRWVADEE